MNKEFFIAYLNVLEGAKTATKNFHWASRHNDIHVRLDDFYDVIKDFQDSVAEGYMGILGPMPINCIKGNFPATDTPSDMIEVLGDKSEVFYEQLPKNSTYAGLRSETETFIQAIKQHTYLFGLCDQSGFLKM